MKSLWKSAWRTARLGQMDTNPMLPDAKRLLNARPMGLLIEIRLVELRRYPTAD